MFCSKCGTQLGEQQSYCPSCGTPRGGGQSPSQNYQSNEIIRTIDCSGGGRGSARLMKVFSVIIGVFTDILASIFLIIGLITQTGNNIGFSIFLLLMSGVLFHWFIPHVMSKLLAMVCYVRNTEISGITKDGNNLKTVGYTVAYQDLISVEKKKAGGQLFLNTKKGPVRIQGIAGGELDWLYQFLLSRMPQSQ